LPGFLVIAGEQDEAFIATQYAPVMSGVTDKGRYIMVPGTGHLGIVDSPQAAGAIRGYLHAL